MAAGLAMGPAAAGAQGQSPAVRLGRMLRRTLPRAQQAALRRDAAARGAKRGVPLSAYADRAAADHRADRVVVIGGLRLSRTEVAYCLGAAA